MGQAQSSKARQSKQGKSRKRSQSPEQEQLDAQAFEVAPANVNGVSGKKAVKILQEKRGIYENKLSNQKYSFAQTFQEFNEERGGEASLDACILGRRKKRIGRFLVPLSDSFFFTYAIVLRCDIRLRQLPGQMRRRISSHETTRSLCFR